MHPDDRLTRLWSLDAPPVRDAVFERAVMARVERRRWLVAGLEFCALAIAALAVAWAAWPFVSRDLIAFAPMLAAAAAVALAIWSVNFTLERLELGGYEDFTRDSASE